jgi:hypothetical protein
MTVEDQAQKRGSRAEGGDDEGAGQHLLRCALEVNRLLHELLDDPSDPALETSDPRGQCGLPTSMGV